jgi:hypothetical protein
VVKTKSHCFRFSGQEFAGTMLIVSKQDDFRVPMSGIVPASRVPVPSDDEPKKAG